MNSYTFLHVSLEVHMKIPQFKFVNKKGEERQGDELNYFCDLFR